MREPPSTFRQRENEEIRRRFLADIQSLRGDISEQVSRFQNVVPPLLLRANLPKKEREAACQRAEQESRARVDAVIRGWLSDGTFSGLRASDEFWLAARFEHADWLASCILTPDRDGVRRYIPTYGGELLSGFREWLLIHTWAEAGCDRFLRDMVP
jgi:hypothetical protein